MSSTVPTVAAHLPRRDVADGAPTGPPEDVGAVVPRVIGALFLAGFLSYGIGFALVSAVTSAPDPLAAVAAHRTQLTVGALLMFLNTAVDVGKAVLFFPVLERHSRRTALTYLCAMTVEVVLLSVGVLGLLALVPLGRQGVSPSGAGTAWSTTGAAVLVGWNALAYQLGEIALACGAVVLCTLLYRTRLLPRLLAWWGLIGYAVLMVGAVAEILGTRVGLALSVPGGLWEIALAGWLILKGFSARPGATAAGPVSARAAAPAPA